MQKNIILPVFLALSFLSINTFSQTYEEYTLDLVIIKDSIGKEKTPDIKLYEAPTKPTGKTIVGILLTSQGAAATTMGIIMLLDESPYGKLFGILFSIWGVSHLAPGIIYLVYANYNWKEYNEWKSIHAYKKQDINKLYRPCLNLTYTFEF